MEPWTTPEPQGFTRGSLPIDTWTTRTTMSATFPTYMAKFHTIKQAADITGKSESTIKRLLTEIKNSPDSPDRSQILPMPEQYEQFKEEGILFHWQLSEELLRQRFADAFQPEMPEKKPGEGTANSQSPNSADERYVDRLERDVDRLEDTNRELRRQNESLTTSLTELTSRVTTMLGHIQIKALGPAHSDMDGATEIVIEDLSPSNANAEEGSRSDQTASASKAKANRKKQRTKRKLSAFERYTPTFHQAASKLRRPK